jgi:hypothetical protein
LLKIRGDIRKSRCTTGVNDTGGKFATGVNDNGGKLPPVSTTPSANLPPVSTTPAANFATSSPCVVDTTGGKFATGVNETKIVSSSNYWDDVCNGIFDEKIFWGVALSVLSILFLHIQTDLQT